MHNKLQIKSVLLTLVLLVFALSATACDNSKLQKSAINEFIDNRVNDTVTVIAQRDVKLARDVWSDLSELSVKLNDQGKEDLGAEVAQLALSYEKLISYCDNGQKESLEAFTAEFKKSAGKVVSELKAEGYDCDELEESLKKVYE